MKKNYHLHAFFFLKNLVHSKKSCNFALGFGNETRNRENNASLAQLARARDL